MTVWLRLVDPECPRIPRLGVNDVAGETEELDRRHRAACYRCMTFAVMLAELEDEALEGDPGGA